jgi:hypothetical protein
MTDLAATDLTFTVLTKDVQARKRRILFSLAFGDGALTWPAGGIAITPTMVGLLNRIDQVIMHAVNGYHFEFNKGTGKLMCFFSDLNAGADGPDIEASTIALAAGTYYGEAIGT